MKTELKNFQHSSHIIALNKGSILAKKNLIFYVYFLKLNIFLYLCDTFEVSSTILTSFRQGGGRGYFIPPHAHLKTNP